jgi:hypothetical protein
VPVLDRYLPQPGRPFNIPNLLNLDHKTPVRLCVFDHSGSESPKQRNGAFIVASAGQKLASEVAHRCSNAHAIRQVPPPNMPF